MIFFLLLQIDLDKMQLIKPFFGELRRSYRPAFWLHCRKSFNYYYFQWKIHKLQVTRVFFSTSFPPPPNSVCKLLRLFGFSGFSQVDNQLPNSVFQSVVYPKVVSYDVIRKYGLKPCLEGTIVRKRKTDYERDVYK